MRIAGITYDPRELQTVHQIMGVRTYLDALRARRPAHFKIVFEPEADPLPE